MRKPATFPQKIVRARAPRVIKREARESAREERKDTREEREGSREAHEVHEAAAQGATNIDEKPVNLHRLVAELNHVHTIVDAIDLRTLAIDGRFQLQRLQPMSMDSPGKEITTPLLRLIEQRVKTLHARLGAISTRLADIADEPDSPAAANQVR